MNFSRNAWYLLILYSRDRKALFGEGEALRYLVREQWMALSERFPEWTSESIGIEKHCLNAVVALRTSDLPQGSPDERLADILQDFREHCESAAAALGKGPIWGSNFREKPLKSEEEYRNARAFVMQSILGEELSQDWDEEDEEW